MYILVWLHGVNFSISGCRWMRQHLGIYIRLYLDLSHIRSTILASHFVQGPNVPLQEPKVPSMGCLSKITPSEQQDRTPVAQPRTLLADMGTRTAQCPRGRGWGLLKFLRTRTRTRTGYKIADLIGYQTGSVRSGAAQLRTLYTMLPDISSMSFNVRSCLFGQRENDSWCINCPQTGDQKGIWQTGSLKQDTCNAA